MDFIRSWKFAMIIFAVLCVAAVAGVIYGVVTHTEPGLMPGAPFWTREEMPLPVCVHSYGAEDGIDDPVLAEDYDHAVSMITLTNDRLGFAALEPSGGDACLILMTYGVPSEVGWQEPGGTAEPTRGYCTVQISNVTGELKSLVVQHELGHCLGLDHDDWEGSIMRREQSPTPDRAYPPRITDSDRELLRSLYAP